jgi:hypothetical protein
MLYSTMLAHPSLFCYALWRLNQTQSSWMEESLHWGEETYTHGGRLLVADGVLWDLPQRISIAFDIFCKRSAVGVIPCKVNESSEHKFPSN